MTEDLYSDAPAGEATPAAPEEAIEAKTALLPLDFFQGKPLEPGSTCTLKVERVSDDQVEVSYVSESGDSEEISEEVAEVPPEIPEDMMS